MAMLAARLALKKSLQLQQQQQQQQQQQRAILFSSSSSSNSILDSLLNLLPSKQLQQQQQQLRWSTSSTSSSSSSSEDENSNGARNEVTVAQGGNDDDRQMKRKEKLNKSWFPMKLMNKLSCGLWRNSDRRRDPAIPSNLNHLFSSGLGNALVNASDNLNKLIESWALPSAHLMGQMKENKSHYKLRFEVPGLSKDEVKITIEDGMLTIKGEHKEEEEEDDEEGFYGYYDTSLLLPDDAKVEEIKAEMKDGVLYITIPRTEMKERVIKEIQIN